MYEYTSIFNWFLELVGHEVIGRSTKQKLSQPGYKQCVKPIRNKIYPQDTNSQLVEQSADLFVPLCTLPLCIFFQAFWIVGLILP